jgi:phosphatidate cytidylyltransferase
MALNWPTFFTRLGSAIVFAIIMMAGLLWNIYAFMALVLLIQVLCLREYFRLLPRIFQDVEWPRWLHVVTQIAGLAIFFARFAFSPVAERSYPFFVAMIPAIMLLVGALRKKTALMAVFAAFGGLCYIVLPATLLTEMRLTSIVIPLALILMIWMNDTMAYLVGSFIGKTPFSPISPKKTWEGTAGGAILTIIGAAVWGYFTPYYHMIDWMVLALCAAVAGTAGDLLESRLKRLADVKDSGTMMPGHGGALDRFDSLLVATPFAFVYVYLFMDSLPLTIF